MKALFSLATAAATRQLLTVDVCECANSGPPAGTFGGAHLTGDNASNREENCNCWKQGCISCERRAAWMSRSMRNLKTKLLDWTEISPKPVSSKRLGNDLPPFRTEQLYWTQSQGNLTSFPKAGFSVNGGQQLQYQQKTKISSNSKQQKESSQGPPIQRSQSQYNLTSISEQREVTPPQQTATGNRSMNLQSVRLDWTEISPKPEPLTKEPPAKNLPPSQTEQLHRTQSQSAIWDRLSQTPGHKLQGSPVNGGQKTQTQQNTKKQRNPKQPYQSSQGSDQLTPERNSPHLEQQLRPAQSLDNVSFSKLPTPLKSIGSQRAENANLSSQTSGNGGQQPQSQKTKNHLEKPIQQPQSQHSLTSSPKPGKSSLSRQAAMASKQKPGKLSLSQQAAVGARLSRTPEHKLQVKGEQQPQLQKTKNCFEKPIQRSQSHHNLTSSSKQGKSSLSQQAAVASKQKPGKLSPYQQSAMGARLSQSPGHKLQVNGQQQQSQQNTKKQGNPKQPYQSSQGSDQLTREFKSPHSEQQLRPAQSLDNVSSSNWPTPSKLTRRPRVENADLKVSGSLGNGKQQPLLQKTENHLEKPIQRSQSQNSLTSSSKRETLTLDEQVAVGNRLSRVSPFKLPGYSVNGEQQPQTSKSTMYQSNPQPQGTLQQINGVRKRVASKLQRNDTSRQHGDGTKNNQSGPSGLSRSQSETSLQQGEKLGPRNGQLQQWQDELLSKTQSVMYLTNLPRPAPERTSQKRGENGAQNGVLQQSPNSSLPHALSTHNSHPNSSTVWNNNNNRNSWILDVVPENPELLINSGNQQNSDSTADHSNTEPAGLSLNQSAAVSTSRSKAPQLEDGWWPCGLSASLLLANVEQVQSGLSELWKKWEPLEQQRWRIVVKINEKKPGTTPRARLIVAADPSKFENREEAESILKNLLEGTFYRWLCKSS